MEDITIDFETYFDSQVSLKKLPTLAYIRHPKFKVHGASVKVGASPARWLAEPQLSEYFRRVDWPRMRVISHNALFDLTVLHEKYGVIPGDRVDTLGLCRALLPRDLDFDLDRIGSLLGLEGKKGGGAALEAVKGVEQPTQEQLDELGEYAVVDAEICYGIYQQLYEHLPKHERRLMNLVLRMSTQGVFEVDSEAFTRFDEAEQEILDHRYATAQAIGINPDDDEQRKEITSRDRFARMLQRNGIEPPTKISARTGKETWAFSVQDEAFIDLRSDEHAAPYVEARMAWASNTAISRVRSLREIGSRWPHTIPVQLNYNGAHTGRLSGGGKINAQNLNARGRGSQLRKGFRVRDGYVVIVYDLSKIELVLNLWFAGDPGLESIRQGGDPYREQAAAQFGVPESDIGDKDTRRQFGKVIELGLGYGMGGPKFRKYVAAGPMGMEPMKLTDQQAQRTVETYRRKRWKVVNNWHWLDTMAIPHMAFNNQPLRRGPIEFVKEAAILPNEMRLNYAGLRLAEDDSGWVFGVQNDIPLWGGTLDENIIQALAGVLIKDHMLQIDDAFDGDAFMRLYQLPQFHKWDEQLCAEVYEQLAGHAAVVHQVHDEVLVVARERDADEVSQTIESIMTTPPTWGPDIPLKVEGGWDQAYSK